MKRSKRFLSSLLAVVLLAALLAGCGGKADEPAPAPTTAAPASPASPAPAADPAPARGVVEELRVGITKDIEPRSLTSESGSFGRMNYNAFCAGTLLVRDSENQIRPNLMTDWEIAEDGSYIIATFATDQGITWHDGEPFTIDDVIFTIDFMNNVLSSGYMSKVTAVEKLSDTQLKLIIPDHAAYFTLGNSAVFVRVYPKHIWENIELTQELCGRRGHHRLRAVQAGQCG